MSSLSRVEHSYGFFRYGVECLEGYKIIAKERPEPLDLFSLKSYLIARSIELCYKAMLYECGITERELKNTYGHNLKLISVHANALMRKHDLYQLCGDDDLVIWTMNDLYQNKSLEYIQEGAKSAYEPEKFFELAVRISNSVERYLEDRLVKTYKK